MYSPAAMREISSLVRCIYDAEGGISTSTASIYEAERSETARTNEAERGSQSSYGEPERDKDLSDFFVYPQEKPLSKFMSFALDYRAAGILFYDDTHVFLMSEKGKFGEPGGKFETNDVSPLHTAMREFWEETGIKLIQEQLNITKIYHLDFESQPIVKTLFNYILFVARAPKELKELPGLYRIPIKELVGDGKNLKNRRLTRRFYRFVKGNVLEQTL